MLLTIARLPPATRRPQALSAAALASPNGVVHVSPTLDSPTTVLETPTVTFHHKPPRQRTSHVRREGIIEGILNALERTL